LSHFFSNLLTQPPDEVSAFVIFGNPDLPGLRVRELDLDVSATDQTERIVLRSVEEGEIRSEFNQFIFVKKVKEFRSPRLRRNQC
jgi:hypothetical protein